MAEEKLGLSAEELKQLADACYGEKKYEEAIQWADQSLVLNLTGHTIWVIKIASLEKLKNYEKALETVEDALKIHPTTAIFWWLRGDLQFRAGDCKKALECANRALESNENFPSVFIWCLKSAVLLYLGDKQGALDAAQKAVEISPIYPTGWIRKSETLLQLKNYKEAIDAAEKAIEVAAKIDSNSALSWVLGKPLCEIEGYTASQKAIEIYVPLHLAWYIKGMALLKMNKWDEAVVAAEKAIQLDSTSNLGWLLKSQVLLESKEFTAAYEAVIKAIEINEKDEKSWILKAQIEFERGNYHQAINSAKKTLELNPKNARAWVVRSQSLMALGMHSREWHLNDENNVKEKRVISSSSQQLVLTLRNGTQDDDAGECALYAIQANPGDGEAYVLFGRCLKMRLQYEEALKYANIALKINANDRSALLLKAQCLNGLNKSSEAIECADEVLKQAESNDEAWFIKADSYFKLLNFSQAAYCVDEALNINPRNFAACLLKINLLMKEEAYDAAIKFIDEILPYYPTHNSLPYTKGICLLLSHQHERALKCFEEMLREDPTNLYALQGKAFCNFKSGNKEKCETLLRQVDVRAKEETLTERVVFLYEQRSTFFFILEEYKHAEEAIKRALLYNPTNQDLQRAHQEVRAFTQKEKSDVPPIVVTASVNNLEGSVMQENIAVQEDQHPKEVVRLQPDALFKDGQYLQALACAEEILARDPTNEIASEVAARVKNLQNKFCLFPPPNSPYSFSPYPPLRLVGGNIGHLQDLSFKGKHREIIDFCAGSNERHSFLPFYSRKGFSLFCLGRYDEAFACFEDELINIALNCERIGRYGREYLHGKQMALQGKAVYLWKQGEKEKAEQLMAEVDALINESPHEPSDELLWQRGELFFTIGEYERAAEAFERVKALKGSRLWIFNAETRLNQIKIAKEKNETLPREKESSEPVRRVTQGGQNNTVTQKLPLEEKEELDEGENAQAKHAGPEVQVNNVLVIAEVPLLLGEIEFNVKNAGSYYSAAFIDALVCCRLRQENTLSIHAEPAATPDISVKEVTHPSQDPLQLFWEALRKTEPLLIKGEHEKAVLYLNSILEVFPFYPLYCKKGFSLFCLGQYDEALRCFEEDLNNISVNTKNFPILQRELNRSEKWALQGKAVCLWRMGKHEEAEQLLIHADADLYKDKGITAEALWQRGELFFAINEYERAYGAFKDAAHQAHVSYSFYASMRVSQLDRSAKRNKDGNREKEVDASQEGETQACDLLSIAELMYRVAEYQEACDYIAETNITEYTKVEALILKAQVLSKQGNHESAIKCFDEAIALGGERCLSYKGVALFCAGEYENSRQCFEEVLERYPHHEFALQGKALCLWQSGEKNKAEQLLEEVNAKISSKKSRYKMVYLWNQEGDLFFALREYDRAHAAFKRAQQVDSSNFDTRQRLAVVEKILAGDRSATPHIPLISERRLDSLEEALIFVDQILQDYPGNIAVWLWKISTLQMLYRWQEALACVESALKHNVDDVDLLVIKIRLLNDSCLKQDAIDTAKELLRVNPHDTELLLQTASWLSELSNVLSSNKGDLCLSYVEAILKTEKENIHAQKIKISVLDWTQQYEEILLYTEELLRSSPGNVFALNKKAEALFSLERYEDAIECVMEILTDHPKDEDANYLAAELFYRMRRYKEARVYHEKSHASFGGTCGDSSFSFSRRELLCLLNDYESLITWADEELAFYETDWFALQTKAHALNALSRYKEAVEVIEKVLSDHPAAAEAWLCKAYSLVGLNQQDDARFCAQKVLEVDSTKPEDLCWKAEAFLILDEPEKAMECANAALKVNAENISALLIKAALLQRQGSYQEAIECVEALEAIELEKQDAFLACSADSGRRMAEVLAAKAEAQRKITDQPAAVAKNAAQPQPRKDKEELKIEDNSEETMQKEPTDLEEDLLAFEAIKAIAQEEHQPEPVSSPEPTPLPTTEISAVAPAFEEVRRKSNLECMYLPKDHATSDKTPASLFIVYPIMGGVAELKEFSNNLNKRVLDKHNLAVYLWRSPLLNMDCEAEGFQEKWEAHCSMEKQAEAAIAGIKSTQPHGPYYLCGWSYGGALTLEIARQLQAQDERVKYIALIDPQTPEQLRALKHTSLKNRLLMHINYISGELLKLNPLIDLNDAGEKDKTDLIHFAFSKAFETLEAYRTNPGYKKLKSVLHALYANYLAIYGYYPEKVLVGEKKLPAATVYVASDKPEFLEKKEYSFHDFAGVTKVKLTETVIEGANHFDIVCKPQMANLLTRHLKNIAKIKLSNKLWSCLERHYRTLEFGSLQFLYDDVPFDIRECDFNVSATSTAEEAVTFDSLFEDASTVRHALVVGDAGIGKTILSRQSTLRNVSSQLWAQKKWLFYIPLQNLAAMEPKLFETHQLVEHLLYHGIFKVFGVSLEEVATFWKFIEKEPQSICFILDGLDELPESPQLNDVLKALFLLDSSVVLTTRNYRTSRLRTLGFTPEVKFMVKPLEEKPLREIFIPKYFQKLGKPASGEAMLAWIDRYPLMQEFTETPLHLTMVCSIWDKNEKEMEKGEMPLVDIFHLSVKNMFRRFLVHERLAQLIDLNDLTDDEIEQMTHDVSVFLALCAFERIQSGCRGFSSKQLNQLLKRVEGGKNFFAKVLASGFIQAMTYAQYDIDRSFQFNSQAMEVYFGCQYVIERLNARTEIDHEEKESLCKFIQNVRENFDPALVEILLVRELTAGGKKRFVSLCSATVEKEYDFNSVRMMTCALESDKKSADELTMSMNVEAESEPEAEIPEELGEILYCFSSYFAKAYHLRDRKDRPDVDSKELLRYKNQIEALKVQSPETFERVTRDERFIRPYEGKEGVLHYAVRRKSLGLLRLLLKLNPNLTLKNDKGSTPLGLACELKFEEGIKLLNAYAEWKAKHEKQREIVRTKTQEDYIALWRAGKLKEVDRYLEEKIGNCQKINHQGKLGVKEMAEIFDLFKYMETYAKDEVFQEALCELIKTEQNNELTQKVLDFYNGIFSEDVEFLPEEYRALQNGLVALIEAAKKNVGSRKNRQEALKIAVKDYAHNKIWLKDFIKNALKEICTDNFTKALILTHLIQKYKRNELFKKWEFTQKLKELVGHVCEKFYKDEIDTKVEKEMEKFEEGEDVDKTASAVPNMQKVAAHLSFFQRPSVFPQVRVMRPNVSVAQNVVQGSERSGQLEVKK